MTHRARVLILVVLAFALQRGIANASEGWLDRLSGPGPFTAHISPMWRIFCVPMEGSREPRVNPRACQPGKSKAYLAYRWTRFVSQRNDLFSDAKNESHQVILHSNEFTWFTRVADTLDVGAGLNLEVFRGEEFATFTRGSIKPIDVQWRPLGGLGSSRWLQVLSLSVNARTFFPQIRQTANGLPDEDGDKYTHTFCRPGKCQGIGAFSTEGEFSWGTGLYIDLTSLF